MNLKVNFRKIGRTVTQDRFIILHKDLITMHPLKKLVSYLHQVNTK